jgi:hypothetical protein
MLLVAEASNFAPGCLFRMKFETCPDWPTEQDEGLALSRHALDAKVAFIGSSTG